MKPMNMMIIGTIIMTLALLSYGTADSGRECSVRYMAITKIVNSLGFRLEHMIEDRGNYFFSPLSISTALAMVYFGARGTTREQISEALEYDIVGKNCLPNKISESFRELMRSLHNEGDGYSFLIANGAFIQTGYPISHFYSSNLQKFFNSNVKFLNFQEKGIDAMNDINKWAANYTKGKISQLLNEPLDPMTVMILLNAVYFKGLWSLPFDENSTREDYFYRINDTAKTVQFMIMQEEMYHYYDAERRYSVLELDYLGGNITMIIILPKNIYEFPDYELTSDLFCEMKQKLEDKSILVLLPKFKMAFSRELSKDMSRMGMEELFSDRADLSGIREKNDLHVSLMVHKAVIEVNEKGSEASGISGLGINGRKKSPLQEIFIANHPFLFYIVHSETNTILFSGRVTDP